jgi:hypothetical protein
MKKSVLIALVLAVTVGLLGSAAMAANGSGVWQIGKPDGDVNPIDGAAEYPEDRAYNDEVTYYVGTDSDPINSPTIPGLIGPFNVCDIDPNRPCTDTTAQLNIHFTLDHGGEFTLVYDRYGSETDALSLDDVSLGTVSGTGEGRFQHNEIDLGDVSSGNHVISIAYVESGAGNGHYIDYLKLACREAVFDLIAGGGNPASAMNVGDVLVWEDGGNLYAKYMTTGDWCITGTHLQVATSLDGIPQKNGNPIPGKFEHKDAYALAPCVQATAPILLGNWSAGTSLYIAAHAVVVRPIDGCSETVWQIGDVEVVNASTGWLENYADEFNWGDPAGPTTAGPTLAEEQPAFTDPFMVGTTPTSEFPFNSNDSRNYATDFDVQWNGGLPFGGKLIISWSPGQSATEKKVVSDGFSTATFTDVGTPSPGKGWFLDTYPLVQNSVDVNSLSMGTHTINFQHTQGDGTYWDWILLEKPCEQWETAWGAGMDFDGKNWATYFMYTVGTCSH